MNFSKNKTAIRCVSLMTALVLTTAMLAGCKKSETTPPSTEGELNLNINLDTTPSTEPTASETKPTETKPVVNEKSATVISQLNIRSAPSTNGSSVLGTLYAGDKVIVERRETLVGIQWAYISSPQTGWICMDFVEMDMPDTDTNENGTPGETAPTKETTKPTEGNNNSGTTSTKGVVTTGLNIRKEPSTSSAIVGSYAKGDVVTITETQSGWGRTSKGWIKMEYVNTTGNTTNTGSNSNTNNNGGTTNVTGNGSTTVQFKGVVRAQELNIRASASTSGERLGSYTYGTRVEFYEKSGNWGRTNKGWISLDYVYQDGTTGSKTATGTVTGNGLNIRSGPGKTYASVGSLNKGDKVNILEQFTYNGTTWGCIKNGWISMDYVDTGSGTTSGTTSGGSSSSGFTGVITGNQVNVRSGPGTNYNSVGHLDSGAKVTITELKTVDGMDWGKTSQGWISMKYVKID